MLILVQQLIKAQACYELVWSDEFNYTGRPDATKWLHEVNGDGGGNNELQYYTDRLENARVVDSVLIIEARKENYQGKQYTSARLTTHNKAIFKYGKMEARIKLPYGQGIWPAFWMMGDNIFNGTGWPACGETDILELVGGGENRDDKMHGTIHWTDANGNHAQYGGSKQLSTGIFHDDYHVFSIEWNETTIRWYLDGQQFHVVSITPSHMTEFHKDFFLLLNLAVGGNWPGNPNSSTKFPQQMVIDYVRVYQLNKVPVITGENHIIKSQNGIEFSTVESSTSTYHWLVPEGVQIVKGQGTHQIEVNWACAADTVRCELTTACKTHVLEYPVQLKALQITGNEVVAAYEETVEYQIQATSNASYEWIFPEMVSSSSTLDSNVIHLNWGMESGILKVKVNDLCGLDSASLSVTAINQRPYPNADEPHAIPGIIESTNYDTGGEGIAYHDFEMNNNGVGPRQNEGVDTEYNDGSSNIGWTEAGEWMEYTIQVETSSFYDLEIRVASTGTLGKFKVLFNGEDKTGIISAPNTKSWSAFSSIKLKDIELSAADKTMRVEILNGQFNLGKLTFTSAGQSGTHDLNQDNRLSIYPTIVKRNIRVQNLHYITNYTITNIAGKVVTGGVVLPNSSIQGLNLKSGTYMLNLFTENSRNTFKFITVD